MVTAETQESLKYRTFADELRPYIV
jgi:hypothetical protein